MDGSPPARKRCPDRREVAFMHTQPPLAPRGSPVPGVIPEPVRVGFATVADDGRGGTETRLATDRWVDEGGGFDPDGPGLAEVTLGRR
jgi:hypothetical protein